MYYESNTMICRRFLQMIMNEGQLWKIRDFVSSNAVNHELGDEIPAHDTSPDQLAQYIQLYRTAFPDLHLDIQEQIAEGDRVVTLVRMRGTQMGPLLGVGASGKKMDVPGVRIDRFADGKIAESWFHWDTLGMLQQIGALPKLRRDPLAAPPRKEPLPVLVSVPYLPPVASWNEGPEASTRSMVSSAAN